MNLEQNGVRRILPPIACQPRVNECWAKARDEHPGDWIRTDLAASAISEHRRRRQRDGYRLSVRNGEVWVRWRKLDVRADNPASPL